MQIVWFKRDLRIDDHAALSQATQNGAVLPLYIIEPELWQCPDMSRRQYLFLVESLQALNAELTRLGQPLIIKVGRALDVLKGLHEHHPISALWSHQETGNYWTYQRDLTVKAWTTHNHIPWHEPLQHGVFRRLASRDGWAARWHQFMYSPKIPAPTQLPHITNNTDNIPTPEALEIATDDCPQRQIGGREQALSLLESFLNERGEYYSKAMSSPNTAFDACSRLSPHISFGTISMREVTQACQQRSEALKNAPKTVRGQWLIATRAFASRLRWHCHFIQKLEDEPRIEFENMHSAYDELRQPNEHDAESQVRLAAWQQGKTGFPMIDACMRALRATGWINFRMRAMLMSFASYHLWLHWREPALHLARCFTDYEPGIHYSQAQMQSGTTGINSIRIYNPIKQGIDHDPEGVFIRRWIPELKELPQKYIHQPWLAPYGHGDYPIPIVDEKQARKAAADQLYGLRKRHDHKLTADQIAYQHGSRKAGLPDPNRRSTKRKKRKKSIKGQGELPL